MKTMVIRPLARTCVEVEFKRGQYTKFVNDLAKGVWRTYDFEIEKTQAVSLFNEMKHALSSGACGSHHINGYGYGWYVQVHKGMWPMLTKKRDGRYILQVNTIR